MFYSNQLLSRKGPLGQIWIAATMHAKINRRKAEQIDIAEICEQILNPVVPLALRLSGILMGGVVLIYDRKVRFFSEDVNNLLIQIKTVTAIKDLDIISLPKEKTQARFEAITIEYGFDKEYSEIERVMLQPHTADDRNVIQDEEFFFIPGSQTPKEETKPQQHKFQVEQEKITIQEDLLQPDDISEFGRGDNDDRIPPPNDIIMEDLCPEFQLQGPVPPVLTGMLDDEMQQSTVQGLAPEDEVEAHKSSKIPPQQQRTRTRRKTKNKALMDIDYTEIPAQIFTSWLKDPSDIVKDNNRRGKRHKAKNDDLANRYFSFPSSSLCWSANSIVDTTWAPPLIMLWDQSRASKKKTPPTDTDSSELPRRTRRGSEETTQSENIQEANLAQMDISTIEAAETLQEFQDGIKAPDYGDYGSIERLRSALHTPDLENKEEFFVNQLGLTPMLSGQSGKSRKAPKIATPGSGQLSLDKDVDCPRDARSKRSRIFEAGKNASPSWELLPDDYLKETITPTSTMVGAINTITLSQFELQETGPSQEPLHPYKQSIDKISNSMLQFLREQFGQQPTCHISSDDLTRGLDKSHASKLFYQICVLASNGFISVEQPQSFGNIRLYKGAYF